MRLLAYRITVILLSISFSVFGSISLVMSTTHQEPSAITAKR